MREATKPDPVYDYGVVVQITLSGFQPATLITPCCEPVIWENLTNIPQTVTFVAFLVNSGPIAPGASWVYTPKTAVSIAYHAADPSIHGVVQSIATEP